MTAVCIIGSYDNEANRPEEFRGRFAEEIKQYRHPRNKAQPNYLRNYGNIQSGIKYRLYRNVYNPILFVDNFMIYSNITRFFHIFRYAIGTSRC